MVIELKPTCPKHGMIAVYRDIHGYWFCPKCLDELTEKFRKLKNFDTNVTKVIFVYEAPKDSGRVALWRKLFGFKTSYRTQQGDKNNMYPGILDKGARIDQSTILVPRSQEKQVEEILKKYAKSYRKFYVIEEV